MNKLNCSGGIKFRELDYSKSPTSNQTNKSKIRSRDDVLKLFNSTILNNDVNSQTEEIKPSDLSQNSEMKICSIEEEIKPSDLSRNSEMEICSTEEESVDNSCSDYNLESEIKQSSFKSKNKKLLKTITTTNENIKNSCSFGNTK